MYGTRAGVIPSTADVVSTRRDGVHDVHVLNYTSEVVALTNVPADVQHATLVHDGSEVKAIRQGDTLRLTIPWYYRDPIDTVVKLTA